MAKRLNEFGEWVEEPGTSVGALYKKQSQGILDEMGSFQPQGTTRRAEPTLEGILDDMG